jgi:hypothetical protein
LTIEDERPWRTDEPWEVLGLASRYLNEVRIVPYRTLAINFRVFWTRNDPLEWITEKFLNPDLTKKTSHDLLMVPTLFFSMPDGPFARLSMNGGSIQTDSDVEQDAVLVTAALIYDEPLDRSEMMTAINRLPQNRDAVLALLAELLEEGL